MGLDMYLKVSKNVYKGSHFVDEDADKIPASVWGLIDQWASPDEGRSVTVEGTAIYWRKANQIHNWFVQNCQGGRDECQETEVGISDLKLLLVLVKTALAKRDASILPPTEGFFFGSTEIDEGYWEELAYTNKALEAFLDKLEAVPEEDRPRITYQASW